MPSSRLAISLGCPSGVGPEVSVAAALQAQSEGLRCVLLGDHGAILRAADLLHLDPKRLREVKTPSQCFAPGDQVDVLCPTEPLALSDMVLGSPSAAGGRAQLAWIDYATRLAADRIADAIVTGPVSKEAIAHSGAPSAESFAGHTEHIARLLGVPDPVMVFVASNMTVALVTTHLALADVPSAISIDGVANATYHAAQIVSALGKSPARVVVAALNPHAGEGGLFGSEESKVIKPAIERARERLSAARIACVIDGPLGAETAFRTAFNGHYDAVVSMYHDQGTIPMKLMCFGKAVNVTAGLPIVRTSVDHGTAYDIAGKGKADPDSMLEALRLAGRLVEARG